MEKVKNFEKINFYIFVFVLILALSFANPSINSDMWARLLQGSFVLQTGNVMFSDPFSYPQTHLWIDHEWGSGVVFEIVKNHFGYMGLISLKAILLFFTFVLIFKIINLRKTVNTKLYNFLFFFFVINSMETILLTGVRCHCFTFLFFALFLYILEFVRIKQNYKPLIFLPIIMIPWANMHGGSVSAVGLLLIYTIGEFLNKKPFKNYLYALIGVCPAFFINPYGVDYIKFLLHATTMSRTMIAEWQNIFEIGAVLLWKSKLFLIISSVLILANLCNLCKNKEHPDYTKYFTAFVMLFLACLHIKHLPFFIITAVSFFYDEFFFYFNKITGFLKKILKINSEDFVKKFVFVKEFIVYGFVLLGVFSVISSFKEALNFHVMNDYPVKVAEFMKINRLNGNILNNFGIGSYLSYKLYPQNLIYMDGRYEEVYYDKTTQNNWNFYNFENEWYKIFEDDKIPEYIIVNKEDLIFPQMKNLNSFLEIFRDNKYSVYARKDILKKMYLLPVKDNSGGYYYKNYFEKITDKKQN